MFNPNSDEAPINPLPKAVILLLCIVGGVELVLQLGERGLIGGPMAIGWRLEWARAFGFSDTVFDWMRTNQSLRIADLARLFTYSFIHGSLTHILFILVFILAIGKFVAEICGDIALLVIFMASAVIGALGYGLILDEGQLLIGGYPAVYGLLGAFTWVQFEIRREKGESGARAFQLIGAFMIIQLVYKFMYSGGNDWLAELFGFLTGFGLAIVFVPGGWFRVVQQFSRLRRR
jgi:membrane associated rhomboid family serine protease